MQSDAPYAKFKALSQKQQSAMIEAQVQSEPKPVRIEGKSFPKTNFIQLHGKQDKKAIKLATYLYPPANEKARALVIFIHTMNLHSVTSICLAEALAKQGYAYAAMDIRGHGNSEGQRGYIDSSQEVLRDLTNFIKQCTKMYPGVPLFLIGQGSGSLISIILAKEAKQFKIDGMVLCSPALKKPSNSKVLSAVSDVALKLMPNKAGLFQPNYERSVRNPKASEYLKQDKLVYNEQVKVGTLMQMMNLMKKNDQSNWKKTETPPIVIVQGQMDKIADPINSINFYESIKTKDKQFWWYPNMWTGVFMEDQYEQIQKKIIHWLNKRA